MTVGERMKDLRLKSGISQVELADKMNVSKQDYICTLHNTATRHKPHTIRLF